jgi:membrane protein DedA with SNARE-associated domain
MHNAIEFLLHHGYTVLLVWVFAEQVGLPVPTLPLLLAAGALAGAGRMNFFSCLFLSAIAAVTADTLWFQLGRYKGIKILQFLCKISLEPDSCVRRTEGVFSKRGAPSLLVAKFLPGLGIATPPLAGVFHMRLRRFLLFDSLGALLWSGSYLGLGFAFSGQIERVGQLALALGGRFALLLFGALAAYIAYKFIARQRFLRELRIARITVEELKQKIDAGEDAVIVDLRHSVDFEADPETIPGAFRMDARALEQNDGRLPRDREIVLYCT